MWVCAEARRGRGWFCFRCRQIGDRQSWEQEVKTESRVERYKVTSLICDDPAFLTPAPSISPPVTSPSTADPPRPVQAAPATQASHASRWGRRLSMRSLPTTARPGARGTRIPAQPGSTSRDGRAKPALPVPGPSPLSLSTLASPLLRDGAPGSLGLELIQSLCEEIERPGEVRSGVSTPR